MNCLKCGKETKEHQVFCDSCLQAMEQHPVKPGTPIHLPHRTAQSGPKKSRKRALPADEQIAILKKRSRRLTLFLVLALLALLLALSALLADRFFGHFMDNLHLERIKAVGDIYITLKYHIKNFRAMQEKLLGKSEKREKNRGDFY